MLREMRQALRSALPAASDVEIEAATRAALSVHAFFEPQREVRVTAGLGCNLRSMPGGQVVGTVRPQVLLLAGASEQAWTPVALDCWIGTEMIALA